MNLLKRLRRYPPLRKAYFGLFTARYLQARLAARASYSQDGEDTKIREMLHDVRFFIDIGAYDGITDSNTFLFAVGGAGGICFEPVPETFIKLSALYRLRPGITCRCCGISDATSEATIAPMQGLSFLPGTEDPAHSAHHPVLLEAKERAVVQLKTFDEATNGIFIPDTVDLLNIDVEGHELKVLQSIPFARLRFRMIVVETHLRDRVTNALLWRHRDLDTINALLQGHGYRPVSETFVNTLYAPGPGRDSSLHATTSTVAGQVC
jgi:FkbM family methyltransferase